MHDPLLNALALGWTMVGKTTRITITLGDSERNEMCALSEQYDVSLSWLTRQAVGEFLERYGRGEMQLPLKLPAQGKASL